MTLPPSSKPVPVWTVGSLLTWTADFFAKKNIDEPRLSAELLLAHVLKCSRMALYTQYEKIPGDAERAAFRTLVNQRSNHVPVAHLIGKAWFFSLEFTVTRDVLIPRPDTETLVEFIIQQVRQHPEWSTAPTSPDTGAGAVSGSGPAILDLCTGSGIIAVSLAKQLPAATLTATDISPQALAVAKQNADIHKVRDRITFLEGDLFAPLESAPAPTLFHIIVANPPYIPTAQVNDLPTGIKHHEPRLALDGGPDGLDLHRRILATVGGRGGGAKNFLHAGGLLILEMQHDQGSALHAAFAAAGYLTHIKTIRDAASHPRCLTAVKL
ncbi:MAG: peptide chain release factor N(5)-glutamine methyltransferase [Phycisphaerales bacterium]|nr:peptide chain release factor N(5)-glutamine methyltransferase [Phycisphaerales bacterium]